MIKKALSLLLVLLLLCSAFPLEAFAKEEYISDLELSLFAAPETRTNRDAELAESIDTQLKNFNSRVDIYEFRLPANEANEKKIINILSGGLPECFHIDSSFELATKGGYISGIFPTYLYSKTEYKSMLAECEAVANKMLEGIDGNQKLGDVEKLLLLHDRIAIHCEYDYERYNNDTLPLISHSMYGAFVNKLAVCQGYALAYSYLLDKIGIENYYCGSEELDHAWNIVYVNNKPYHVDITHDDPVWDITGQVYHDNFLVSTEQYKANGHDATDFDSSPKDTTYDDYFWGDSTTAFVLLNNEIYYICNVHDHVIRYSDNKFLYDIERHWLADSKHWWDADFAKLDTDGKGSLLFSVSDAIYSLNVTTGEATVIHKPELEGIFCIYGFTYDETNGNLIYDIHNKYTFDKNTKKLYERKVKYTPNYTSNSIAGDINDSNNINLLDVVVLAQAIAGWDVYYNIYSLDVNGDGIKNLTDVNHLAKYVAGWQGVKLY